MLMRHLIKFNLVFWSGTYFKKWYGIFTLHYNSILEAQSFKFWKHTWCPCDHIIHRPELGWGEWSTYWRWVWAGANLVQVQGQTLSLIFCIQLSWIFCINFDLQNIPLKCLSWLESFHIFLKLCITQVTPLILNPALEKEGFAISNSVVMESKRIVKESNGDQNKL